MAQKKRVRNFLYILKDKASVFAASLSLRRHMSTVRVSILRATTHSLSTPPSEARILAVFSVASNGSHLLPRACINALIDRLHRTRSATVALKCLFTLHNVIVRGPLTLRDHLACYPSYDGQNFLNLSAFRDDSDVESLELSSWVRWYAGVLEQSLSVSRVLGYYLSSSWSNDIKNAKKGAHDRKTLGLSNSELFHKIDVLVGFVELISRVPESLQLQRNDLVYEMVRLVGEDYRIVQYEIFLRVAELRDRVEDLEVGEMAELVRDLIRLEDSKEGLVLLFVNRKRNDRFWELIKQTKAKAAAKKEEREGKWLTAVKTSRRDEASELTRSNNPFLEAGQVLRVPATRLPWMVPTVG
ncbi:putative clathrin assembly protein At4g40080 [Prosopis cineraria]|uniref:putative clathrin assembly protein At4g40080 n=1 Tax=Prosopis cineraria TaxID=364024 RepID=UPI00240F1B12|nr:putative clathrin assembly protein At4g40080 [Prosopis cineraria]